jgi:8-oxo-dGTP pyrophosphatase MutT (NUDIX family)
MNYIMGLRKSIGSEPIIMVAAGVLILDKDNRVLLQERSDNLSWGFIGGALELGEELETAAKREAKEEAGIDITELELFNIYSGKALYNKYPNGDEVYIVSALYRVLKYEGTLTPDNDETLSLKFFELDNLPEKINPPDIYVLKDIREKLFGKDTQKN